VYENKVPRRIFGPKTRSKHGRDEKCIQNFSPGNLKEVTWESVMDIWSFIKDDNLLIMYHAVSQEGFCSMEFIKGKFSV
jgi:hypothetical protein